MTEIVAASGAEVWAHRDDTAVTELNVLGGVRVVHSPGHTPGHLCLYLPAFSLLIAGDLLRLVDGVIDLSPAALSADTDLSLASARRVVALGIEGFVGYHSGYTIAGADKLLSDGLQRGGTPIRASRA